MQLKVKKKKNRVKNKRGFNRKKIILIIIGFITGLLLLIGIIALLNYGNAKIAYQEAMAGKNDFMRAQSSLKEENFAETATSLSSASDHFSRADEAMDKMSWMQHIPWVGIQIKAADNLLAASVNIADAGGDLALLGEEVISIVHVKGEEVSYNTISKKKKKEILQKLYESPDRISGDVKKLEVAVARIEDIPEKGLISALKSGIAPVKDNLPFVKDLINKAVPIVEVLPSVAGYPEEKTYLFLLQNNTELRPTGGFIGTYGILKLESAEINLFETNNIYNLDGPAEQFLFLEPIEAYAKYVDAKNLYMRDANWSPNFPTTAAKTEELYHLENGPEENIDGVIAVTPELIKDLLELTGPIEIDGEEFTSENLVDKLQYKVEFGFVHEGISDANRKDVIGDLATVLMDRILNLPKERWPELWTVFTINTDEKQVLLYIKDENIQKYVEELNWAGEVKDVEYTGRDFVMVVDSNMAALKTDKVMERNFEYNVSKEGDDLIGTLTLHYNNTGTFTKTTTRYRSYTRIYVPKGSELISSEGFVTNDKLKGGIETGALVKQDNELNKTIFEGFIAIEPQTEETIILKYKLPQELKDLVASNKYRLYWQKQPGTTAHGMKVIFDVGDKIKEAEALDVETEIDNNKVQFIGDLRKDRDLNITLQ